MAALSSLYPLLRSKCPGVIDLMMDDALKKSYREFCLRSEFIHVTAKASDVSPGDVISLSGVDGQFYVLSIIKIISTAGTVDSELVVNVDYTHETPSEVVFIGTSTHPAITITYSICPRINFDSSLDLDKDILNRWSDELAAGAASYLRLMPGFPWTSPELYDFYHRDFVRGWREAKRARQESFADFNNYTRKRNFF